MFNHRKNQRQACLVPVVGKSGSIFDHAQAVDFSKGGLGFVSRHRVPVNKKIPIELELTAEGTPVFVIGKVRWVYHDLEAHCYRIGIAFTNVLQGSKSRLNHYFRSMKVRSTDG